MADSKTGVGSFVAVAVLLVFVLVATFVTLHANDGQRAVATKARANAIMTAIDNRMAAYEELLFGAQGVLGVDADLSRASFHELIADLRVDDRLPGVQVIGVAHLVEADDLEQYTASVTTDALASGLEYPPFEVYPPSEEDFLLPIDFIEPQAGNLKAFGLDFFSEPNRREATLRARDTGLSAASAPVTLVQETATQKAILVYVPLYERGQPVETVEQRRAAFTGVVYAAFRMNDLVAGALGAEQASEVSVLDVEAAELLVGDHGTDPHADSPGLADKSAASYNVGEFDVSGRTWRVLVNSDDQVLSFIERSVPIAVLVIGLFVAALMIALMRSMRTARARALVLATEMTIELEALTESASEGIVTVDDQGRVVAWNQAASQMFGATADEMIGRPAGTVLFEGSDDEDIFGGAEQTARPGRAKSKRPVVLTGRRTDGTRFPAELSVSQWVARGSTYSTGFIRDVSERVEAERRLTETKNTLQGVLSAATEMSVIGTDLDGTINVFNAGAQRMLGYTADEVVGRMDPGAFHEPCEVEARAAELGMEPGFDVFVVAARRGEAETRSWTYVRRDGTKIPVDLTVTPRYDDTGTVCGFIGVGVDITERLVASAHKDELLEQEREMVARLTELDRAKSDFVSTMSHELRTPLTSIIGFTELLAEDLAEQSATSHSAMVATISKNAQRLLLLVEDLLTLSRIESGTLHASLEPCDPTALVWSAVDAAAPLADQHEVAIAVEVGPTSEVSGDASELERVFLNLLTNAIKFSEPGGTVTISLSQIRAGDSVVVTVADHGIGIPKEEQSDLFARFFRARNAETHAVQGSGLGLSIVADIVARHSGTIDIESEEGVGTTATVRLQPSHSAEDADVINEQVYA